MAENAIEYLIGVEGEDYGGDPGTRVICDSVDAVAIGASLAQSQSVMRVGENDGRLISAKFLCVATSSGGD